ncbi:MAG: glycoside hydrolase family 31 protein [Elainellaceae cyanobacterium]
MQSFQQIEQGIECDCQETKLQVKLLAPNLVRVRLAPEGQFKPRRSWAVTRDDHEWEQVSFQIDEKPEAIILNTPQLRVRIDRDPCRLSCFDANGNLFAQDVDPGMSWSPGGTMVRKKIASDEHFYGFGERTRLLDKRSEIMTNWTVDALDYNSQTDAMYQAIPFFMALRPELCYGIFLNSTFWSQFDMGEAQPDVWQMQTQEEELDYYIIYGSDFAQILATYTELTGRMPMPPKWSLGYHQCRWSYENEAKVRELAREFREYRIPCDVIHLDIDYMQGYRVFTWHQQRFPDPKALLSDLKDNGFKVVTIVDPGVKYDPEAGYSVFDEGLAQDYFVRRSTGSLFHGYVWPDKAVFPDFIKPDVQQWWGDKHHTLTDAGVAGIWNDMNEPALDDRPFGDQGNKIPFPSDAPQGPEDEETTHTEVHNLYGLMMSKATSEAMKRLRPNERSFILTRSGYAGIQRWASVWMGDNQSLWDHLELSLPMLCNMGLSGVPFVGADIGGFARNATPELFARWMQVGMLYPMMRAHSALGTNLHEPWTFDQQTEDICREFIELRYRLLPYLYSLFWEASTTGAPILRPLVYHYLQDSETHALYDQVLLGSSLMAAPVYRPGVEHRVVYLPEGTWYDWWTGDRHEGSAHLLAHAPLERMPLYAKAGSIIPMQPVMQYVDERPVTELTLKVYPGNGQYTLYEDDGRSFDYQSGAWATTTYQVRQEGNQVIVEAIDRQGNWSAGDRSVKVELAGNSDQGLELVTRNL